MWASLVGDKTLYLIALQLRIERNLFIAAEFKYPHIMRRISLLTVTAFVAISIGFTSASPVKAVNKTIYVANTNLPTNKGLTFCGETNTKGCIDSISIDGNILTPNTNLGTSDYIIAGGVYSTPCRFLETTAASCEAPYMVVYPRSGISATPTGAQVIGEVTINFRRQPGDEPTARVGTVISNGAMRSFIPATSGLRDVATVVVAPTMTHNAMTSATSCSGWVPTIDLCAIPEKGTSASANRVVVMMLPGFRNSVVPPDEILNNCTPAADGSGCIVNVFDPTSMGGWMDTDASVFGLASTDRLTGAAQLKIAGPHYQADQIELVRTQNTCPWIVSICAGSPPNQDWGYTINTIVKNTEPILNLSTFRAFIPSAYLMNSFGLTPAQVNASTLPVRRTTIASSTIPNTTYTPVEGGIRIDTTGIGFSVPTISMSRVLTVRKGAKVSAATLTKAAGLYQAKKFGPIAVVTTKKNGATKTGTNYRFGLKKTITLSLKYKPSKKAPPTTRTLQIVVK
jgi:hypothetical protein